MVRDNHSKYGRAFSRVAEARGIAVLHTAHRAPKVNAICERFLGSVRRECLDYAIRIREPHGIWGGLNELERKQILARRG